MEAPTITSNSGSCDSCSSQGLGDTVAAAIAMVGLDHLAAIYERITGTPCNCKTRQEALNKLFPYGVTETTTVE